MNQAITRAFEEPLRAAGFVKKSGSWYLRKDDTVLLANLQKSQYGDKYYINLAVWMRRFGEQQFPKEAACHIRTRLSSIVPSEDLAKALDGEDLSIPDAKREAILEEAVRREAIPFLLNCASAEGVKRMLSEGKLTKAFVHKDVRSRT